ncbi:hypothetical protein ACFXKR_05440 [Streptomyces violascens]|uniref:hypothetical protein n=1 Tax=Streptomyces violascens TaxID=67381 RepID=UPI0036CEBAA3
MAPGIRSLAAAASLTGALLLTPLPYALAAATPSPGLPPTATPSGTAQASPPGEPSRASPRTTASQAVSEDQHLAGSRAGEGRIRPGRVDPAYHFLPYAPDTADPDEVAPAQVGAAPQPPKQVPPSEPAAPPSLTPTSTRGAVLPPARHHQAPQAVSTDGDLRVHVLSLGAGLALTGLGLGFLALRLRRP